MSNISAFISFIALLFYCVLLVVILRRNLRSKLHLFFSLYLLSMIVWSLGSFMIFAELPLLSTVFWNRFMVVGSMGMPIAFFAFAQTFLMKERSSWLYLGLFSYLLTQLANALGFIITDAYVVDGLLFNQYGPAILIPSVTWALFVGLLGYDLYVEYRQTHHAASRNRIKYLLLVTILTFAGSLTNATELQVFPIDIAFNALSALLISYAILRHHLLDIKLVVRLGLLHSIPTIIIGAAYFLVISLAINLLHAASGTQLFLLSIFVAIMTALIAQPLRNKAQNWIDRLFFREKYDASLMLQRISSTAASVLDLDRLTNLILDEITSTLHIQRAAFFTRHNGKAFTLSTQKGLDHDPYLILPLSHPLVLWLSTNQQPLTSSDLDVLPQFKALWDQERQELEAIGAELFIPLIVSSELVGILAVGPKRSELIYSSDDKLTLTTLADQIAAAIKNAGLFNDESERRREAELLQSAVTEMKVDLNFQQVLNNILIHLNDVIPYNSVCIYLLMEDCLHAVASRGLSTDKDGLNSEHSIDDDLLFQEVRRTNQPLYLSGFQADPRFKIYPRSSLFQSWMGVPLIAHQDVIGYLVLNSKDAGAYDEVKASLAMGFANHAAIAIDNAHLFNRVQELAITDELTGIFNRRHLLEFGEREFTRAQRFNRSLSLIMVDIDHFKQVNDTFGHLVGDQVLRVIAKRCQLNCRNIDILGRYGGEEFMILLPETDEFEAFQITQRLSIQIADIPIATMSGMVSVTASFGISYYTPQLQDLNDLIMRADLALYAAKQDGRNRFYIYSDDHSMKFHSDVQSIGEISKKNKVDFDKIA